MGVGLGVVTGAWKLLLTAGPVYHQSSIPTISNQGKGAVHQSRTLVQHGESNRWLGRLRISSSTSIVVIVDCSSPAIVVVVGDRAACAPEAVKYGGDSVKCPRGQPVPDGTPLWKGNID